MTTSTKLDLTSSLLLLALASVWGGSFFFAEIALTEVPPLTITLHRVFWAAPLLLIVVRIAGIPLPRDPRIWGAYLVMGALNNAIPFSLIFWGQSQIDSGLASILNGTTAMFGAVVAGLLLKDEPLTPNKLAGAGLGLIGVGLIMGPDALLGFNLANLAQLAILAGSLSYAVAAYRKRWLALAAFFPDALTGWCDPVDQALERMTPHELARHCLDQAPVEAWQRLEAKYLALNAVRKEAGDRELLSRFEQNYSKYFELERWLIYHARHAINLGLHSKPSGQRMVDIGCGAGIFSFIGQTLGHKARGFDIETEMYQEMAGVLGVPYEIVRLKAHDPLPEHYRDVDLFTAIATKFDRGDFADPKAKTWGVDEWRFFLVDLASRLRPEGIVYLKPNKFTDDQMFEIPEVGAFLSETAAKATQSWEFVFTREGLAGI